MILTKNKLSLFFVFLVGLCIIGYNCFYIVPEGHGMLLARLNFLETKKPQNFAFIDQVGLHLKLPFLTQSTPIDMRLHNFLYKNPNILTLDQKSLNIEYYTQWQIVNPQLYFLKSHNDVQIIQQELTKKINLLITHTFAQHNLNDILGDQQTTLFKTLRAQVNQQITDLGVALRDIGFKSIDFPTKINQALLKKRSTEQTLLALELRALGKANAKNIQLTADNRAALLLAQAKAEAATIRGAGDAQAAKIYNQAYRKNPKFASFYLSLEAYRKGLMHPTPGDNILVLNTKEEAFNPSTRLDAHIKNIG
jgi:modulator of FtsH protease HflC